MEASRLTKAGSGKSDESFIMRFTAAEGDNFKALEEEKEKSASVAAGSGGGPVDHAKLARERLARERLVREVMSMERMAELYKTI